MLQLKSLVIRLNEWGKDKGKLEGAIEYVGVSGEVKITLSPERCSKLLPVVADAIVLASREVAEQLTNEALASLPQSDLKIG